MTWIKSAAKFTAACLILAAILWSAAWLYARHLDRYAEHKFPAQGQVIEIGEHQIHAIVSGQGPDLVLIHGASGSTRDFTFSLVDQLDDNYRVIAFDRPGFGYSSSVKHLGGTLSQQARLLQMAASELGATRPIVLGQSYGGAVALNWAIQSPESIAGLVIVSGVSHSWPGDPARTYRLLAHPFFGELLAPLYTIFASERFVVHALKHIFEPQPVPPHYRDRIGAALSLRPESVMMNARQRVHLESQIEAMVPHYPRLNTPTRIVHGDADRIVPLSVHGQKLARDLPNAELIALEGVGHMPHHSHEQIIIEAINAVASEAGLR